MSYVSPSNPYRMAPVGICEANFDEAQTLPARRPRELHCVAAEVVDGRFIGVDLSDGTAMLLSLTDLLIAGVPTFEIS